VIVGAAAAVLFVVAGISRQLQVTVGNPSVPTAVPPSAPVPAAKPV